MDESVRAAMQKWPDVPDLYGWLSLDRRGRWHLRDALIEHAGLIAFIGRNYQADEDGRWFFQNGPQRVFVTLAYTPWIARHAHGHFTTHTGTSFEPNALYLDDEGHLLLTGSPGLALLDDRDLLELSDAFTDAAGDPLDATADDAMDRIGGLRLGAQWLALERVTRADVPARFGFVACPAAPD